MCALSVSALAQREAPSQWLADGTVEQLLTAYDSGRYAEFDSLAPRLTSSLINPFDFEAEVERWVEASADRPRRAFVAAAVALELAVTMRPQRAGETPGLLGPSERTINDMRFILVELGCAWLHDHPPTKAEETWHAAVIALARATRSEDQIMSVEMPADLTRLLSTTRARLLYLRLLASFREADKQKAAHQDFLLRLRSQAAGASRSSRINASGWRADHGQHLQARFPESRYLSFLEATTREREQAAFVETLLEDASTPLWIDATEVDRVVKGGARAVRSLPRNRRMDRSSAERLLSIVPEPEPANDATSTYLDGTRRDSAAYTSITLWNIVDPLRVAAAQEPVAAESFLRLGQNYVRLARLDLALEAFARAESLAATPYERYLTRLLRGAAFARAGRRAEALSSLRAALQVVPRAQSASLALAPLLLEEDAREDAARILEDSVRLPVVDDPIDSYYGGDPTAAARAVAKLRQEARR